jgi:hypothetical protein
MARPIKQLVGKHFGRLTVLEFARQDKDRGGVAVWRCQCDCGNETLAVSGELTRGNTRSCGCLTKELQRETHCHSPGSAAKRALYSAYRLRAKARGQTFVLTQDNFAALTQGPCFYCGAPPSCETTWMKGCNGTYVYNTIDRVNSGQGYTLENCVSCCLACNVGKMDSSQAEFLAWIKRIYLYQTNHFKQ